MVAPMHPDYSAVTVHVDPARVVANYRLLTERAPDVACVVKADAYGHGLVEVSTALYSAGARRFFAGSVAEAARLAQALDERAMHGAQVVSLLGPMQPDDAALAVRTGVVLCVHRVEQLTELAALGSPLRVALKLDTGMGRLGLPVHDVSACAASVRAVLEVLRAHPNLEVALVLSHLASADDPQAVHSATQNERYRAAVAMLRAGGVQAPASLANSAAILGHEPLHYEVQRAGIALYGGNPFHGTELSDAGSGLCCAMGVSAPILSVHAVAPGESVSYGCTFTAKEPCTVAVVGIGYADGYARHLGNAQGAPAQMCVNGRRAPIVGRVCMQLTVIDVTDLIASGRPVEPGHRAWVLGAEDPEHPAAIDPHELAGWWGSITYEPFCLLGRNRRVYA